VVGLGQLIVVLAVVFGVILIAVIGRTKVPPQTGASDAQPAGTTSPPPTTILPVTGTAGSVYDLELDPSGDAVWFAEMSISDDDYLVRWNVGPNTVERWAVPALDHNGNGSQVRLDKAGAVWTFANYRLVRFEPDTGRSTVLDLERAVSGALPGALDRGNPNPGTFVTAIVAVGNDMLIARNNVPVLSIVRFEEGALRVVGDHAIPPEFAGALDLAMLGASHVVALPGPSSVPRVGVIDLNAGTAVETVLGEFWSPFSRLSATESSVVVSGVATGATTLDTKALLGGHPLGAPVPAVSSTSPMAAFSQATLDPQGRVVLYDYPSATFSRIAAGEITTLLVLPIAEQVVDGPDGRSVPAVAPPRVADMVADDPGTVWFVIEGTPGLFAIGS
jgi:hypothetical protein